VRADEAARWLRVQRGEYTLVMNFGDAEQAVDIATGAARLVLGTHDGVAVADGGAVLLPALAGALVEAPR
jgi:uncharacterized protein YjlB